MSGTRASYSLDGGSYNQHGASTTPRQQFHRKPDLKKKLVVVRLASNSSPPRPANLTQPLPISTFDIASR
jgi:hypothetical protein